MTDAKTRECNLLSEEVEQLRIERKHLLNRINSLEYLHSEQVSQYLSEIKRLKNQLHQVSLMGGV